MDKWPDFWTDARKKSSDKYYKYLKEEFYAGTGLPVITPANVGDFIDRLAKISREQRPHFQEVIHEFLQNKCIVMSRRRGRCKV